MKKSLWKILTLVSALSFLAVITPLQAQWIDSDPGDAEEELLSSDWWTSSDWFEDTEDTWDYSYDWNESDWYGDEAAGAEFGEENGFEAESEDEDLGYDLSDNDEGYYWNDEFNYGF